MELQVLWAMRAYMYTAKVDIETLIHVLDPKDQAYLEEMLKKLLEAKQKVALLPPNVIRFPPKGGKQDITGDIPPDTA
ncbi:MAG: hypothetical protein FD153_20 [Rhodospirillaceae bacterium]|nr:MAG: hypothetical protein FD153_20 [Rhodospirillaceae bacterium]